MLKERCKYVLYPFMFIQYLLQFGCKAALTQRPKYDSTIWPPLEPS